MDVWHINHHDPDVVELCKSDSKMEKLIQYIGDIEVEMRTDYFVSITRSIIGQLISVKAAETVFLRLEGLLQGDIGAAAICKYTESELQSVGMTKRKASYIHSLAKKVSEGDINLTQLKDLPNEQVVKQLTSLKGIGKWTAEMFLIFSLGRKDVLALDDIGLQRGAKWLYQVPHEDRRDILVKKSKDWQNHYSIASFYLWEAVLRNLVGQEKTIDALTA